MFKKQRIPKIKVDKKVPLLVVDSRWHELFPSNKKSNKIIELEKKLNKLVQEQGQLNNDYKEYLKLKKKMMTEIMDKMDDAFNNSSKKAHKDLEKNKKYIEEINQKLNKYEKELENLPKEIDKLNKQLLEMSMEVCYKRLKKYKTEVNDLTSHIETLRESLKEKVLQKQEREEDLHKIYTYMHDLLGYEIIEKFDEDYGGEK
ncbi:MAG: hypothetical protein ACLFMO_04395 [Eubacteriales bacterium]